MDSEAMEIALRVLTAIISRQSPNPADVEELRRLAPSLADVPVDELAREVVRHAVQLRQAECAVAG